MTRPKRQDEVKVVSQTLWDHSGLTYESCQMLARAVLKALKKHRAALKDGGRK